MITLFASLLGFVSSWVPELFKLLHAKSDQKHELAILELQLQNAEADRVARAQEVGVTADTAELAALYQTYNVGVKWVDAFNATVRPVLTYSFFILYSTVKILKYHMIGDHAPLFQYLDVLWTEEDQAIFAGIISFYFGQRAMNKRKT